ncbi:MAG TPA: hypothetical protein VFI54_18515 [Solirubrobacteraceae bacterium]|nr:hypothetical protein [Solirubrobacteraceae bacterium]
MTSVRATGRGALVDVLALVEGPARRGGPAGGTASALAPGVRAWVSDPDQGVAAVVDSVDGADATHEVLARLAPSELTVAAAVASERACWAEITRRANGHTETGIIGLTFDTGGLVRRLVLFRAAQIPPSATGESASAPPGQPIFEAYFDDLMNSRFREAAEHFSVDALYSHPPYAGGSERILFRGRKAVWRGFAIERGPSPARQVITGFWQRGDRVFIEGVVAGIPNGGTFVSTAQISPHGEITRYVAFYSARRIPSA